MITLRKWNKTSKGVIGEITRENEEKRAASKV